MKKMMKRMCAIVAMTAMAISMSGCYEYGPSTDVERTTDVGNYLQEQQPTPMDIRLSEARYALTRRAYWLNGDREKARMLPPPNPDRPLGSVILMSGSVVVGKMPVDGMLMSLNSYLTPDSEFYEYSAGESARQNNWVPDVDGTYGSNTEGCFWFDPDGYYWEWQLGAALYTDAPVDIKDPAIQVKVGEEAVYGE